MDQNVSEIINAIGEKAKSFHAKMNATLDENDVLNKENQDLKAQIGESTSKIASLESEILELKNKLSSINTNAVVSSASDGPTKEEMDELIKEIDFCIEQIKQ